MPRGPAYFPVGGHGRSPSRERPGLYVSRRQHQIEVGRPLPPPAETKAQRESRENRAVVLSERGTLWVNGVKQEKDRANKWKITTIPDEGAKLPPNVSMQAEGRGTAQTLVPFGEGVKQLETNYRPYPRRDCELSGWVPELSFFLESIEAIPVPLYELEQDDAEETCTADYDEETAADYLKLYGRFIAIENHKPPRPRPKPRRSRR